MSVTAANFAVAHWTRSHASRRVVVSDVADFARGAVPISLSVVAEAAAVRVEVGRSVGDDAVAVAVARRRTSAGDFARSTVVSRSAQANGGVVDVGAFTVSRTRNLGLEVDRAGQRAVRARDVGEALAAVRRREPAVAAAGSVTVDAVRAITMIAATVTRALERAVEETPCRVANAGAVFGSAAVARTVTAAG